jgi:hypothetical protein
LTDDGGTHSHSEEASRPTTAEMKGEERDDPIEGEAGEEREEKMDHRKRKRNRTIRSCVPCHNHKRKVCWGPCRLDNRLISTVR